MIRNSVKLKTPFSKNRKIIPYKIDTGSNGNIMLM